MQWNLDVWINLGLVILNILGLMIVGKRMYMRKLGVEQGLSERDSELEGDLAICYTLTAVVCGFSVLYYGYQNIVTPKIFKVSTCLGIACVVALLITATMRVLKNHKKGYEGCSKINKDSMIFSYWSGLILGGLYIINVIVYVLL